VIVLWPTHLLTAPPGRRTRIAPLISNMSKQYTGRDFSQVKSDTVVSIDELDGLSERSYPLCMRELHRNLRRDHKIRHGGRLQYGLFLKVWSCSCARVWLSACVSPECGTCCGLCSNPPSQPVLLRHTLSVSGLVNSICDNCETQTLLLCSCVPVPMYVCGCVRVVQGIGLTMEDALQFWEREFTKIMTAEQFQKQYVYSVRHYFGKEVRC
jgi:DNA primase large subunit